jgi:hypothetical protein
MNLNLSRSRRPALLPPEVEMDVAAAAAMPPLDSWQFVETLIDPWFVSVCGEYYYCGMSSMNNMGSLSLMIL